MCVAYVYCDYRDAVQQTPLNILGALLNQAITFLSGELHTEIFQWLHDRMKSPEGQPNLDIDEVCNFLLKVLRGFDKAFI
jgi:hypothetical protein